MFAERAADSWPSNDRGYVEVFFGRNSLHLGRVFQVVYILFCVASGLFTPIGMHAITIWSGATVPLASR